MVKVGDRVLVDIQAAVTPDLLAAIEQAGGTVVVSVPYHLQRHRHKEADEAL